MIRRLIELSVRNKTLVVLLTAVLVLAGAWATTRIRVDAIPDLSDVQVIVRTEYPGQAPRIVEDQVTYPLTTTLLAVPHAEVVRGYSMFGTSFVYVLFEDGTDPYWARSRVLEQLDSAAAKLPDGVSPQIGPDATGVGWVYQYVLETGPYCAEHPRGLWHDPTGDRWYAEGALEDLPDAERGRLVHHRVLHGHEHCPIDGTPLALPQQDLADLRSLQDWYLRPELTALEGVSEVASAGGFVKQYQVVVDPVKLRAHRIPLHAVQTAIQRSNQDVGGRLIERAETEFMVRGIGFLGSLTAAERAAADAAGRPLLEVRTERVLEDLRGIALGATPEGAPIRLRDVADVRIGPEIRRGVLEWNGRGETAGGIVVMRYGENARATIERVRARLAELERGLPPGVRVATAYDRSDLIDRSIDTLSHTLLEEILVVSLVTMLFLLHARSALVAVFVLPTGVLASVLAMHLLGINANIMSLGGIAIAIGVMVDSSIVMVENAHKRLEDERRRVARGLAPRPRIAVLTEAAQEVGPSLFFSLLIITVSFLPVFALGGQSGRMFHPLAWTKTLAMAAAALLAVTVIPVLQVFFVTERVTPARWSRARQLVFHAAVVGLPALALALAPLPRLEAYRTWLVGGWIVLAALATLPQRIVPEERHPLSRWLERVYEPFFGLAMRFRFLVMAVAVGLVALTLWPLSRLGSEFMPPLEEGDLLYMPTTDPGISVGKARELLQQTDALLMRFPEVDTVLGKVGRADTATDPAPPSMLETTIALHRDKSRWRQVPVPRFYDDWPEWARDVLRPLWPDRRPITLDELVYGYDFADGKRVPGMNEVLQIPGLTNSWTMPIRTRIDMLATGIRTPIGIKVMGPDLATLADLSGRISQVLRTAATTGPYTTSAFAEKSVGGKYLDLRIDRDAIARHGLHVADVQDVIMSALGGMNVTSTVEGLERYPVNVRYPHELRDDLDALRAVLVPTPSGAQVPLGQLAAIEAHGGPPMIKSENARPTSWVYVDVAGIDIGSYVRDARREVARSVELPPGYTLVWSGQYEYLTAATERLMVIVPGALVAIVLLLYVATRSWLRVGIVLLAVPFSLVGAVWFVWLLDYDLSLAVWVGMIALAGLDAETGLVMLLYLDTSFERFRREGRMRGTDDLWWAVHDGAVKRIRPKTMTVVTTFCGLLPLMWATGAGADTMRRLAAPMIGGLATSFVLELLVYPVLFYSAKAIALRRAARHAAPAGAAA